MSNRPQTGRLKLNAGLKIPRPLLQRSGNIGLQRVKEGRNPSKNGRDLIIIHFCCFARLYYAGMLFFDVLLSHMSIFETVVGDFKHHFAPPPFSKQTYSILEFKGQG